MATGIEIQADKITLVTAGRNFTKEEFNDTNINIIKKYGTKEDLEVFIKQLNDGREN